MMERDSEVGKDAVNFPCAVEPQEIPQVSEIPMHKREPWITRKGVIGHGPFYGIAVLVKREQPAAIPPALRKAFENAPAVAATAKGAVNIHACAFDV